MADETLAQQLTTLAGLLAEVDARLAMAPAAPPGLEDLKSSVDQLRTSMWAILSAGHGVSAPIRVERLKLRRAIDGLRAIQSSLASRSGATRHPEQYKLNELKNLIEYGASPRASIYLCLAAQANAFLSSRGFVTPQDVKDIAYDVLRHRVILSYEAEAEEKTPEMVVKKILDSVPVP